MRQVIIHCLRLLLGLLLLAISFAAFDVSLPAIMTIFRNSNVALLLLVMMPLIIGGRLLMAYKWNLLLRAGGLNFGFWEIFRIYMASSFVGLFLPTGIGGDISRAVLLKRRNAATTKVLAAIFIERMLGILAIGTIALMALPYIYFRYPGLQALTWITAGTVGVCLVVLGLAWSRAFAAQARRLIPRFASRGIGEIGIRLVDAISAYRDQKTGLLKFIVLTVIEVVAGLLTGVVLASALHLDAAPLTIALLLPFVIIAIRIPISVAAIGVTEIATMIIFTNAGIPESAALSFGLAMDITNILTVLPGAVMIFWLGSRKLPADPAAVRPDH